MEQNKSPRHIQKIKECERFARKLNKEIQQALIKENPIEMDIISANPFFITDLDSKVDMELMGLDLCEDKGAVTTKNFNLDGGKYQAEAKVEGTNKDVLLHFKNECNWDFLQRLHKKAPKAQIKQASSYLDFYCKNFLKAAKLFFFFRYTFYHSYGNKTYMEGGPFMGWEDGDELSRDVNAIYHICKKTQEGLQKLVSIYEAGPEERIAQKFSDRPPEWDVRDVDRVRLVLNVQYSLPKNMPTIQQVIGKPFETLLKDREDSSDFDLIKFKVFDNRSLQLPLAYDEYLSQDEDGNDQSFQEEVIQGKKLLENPHQHIVDADYYKWFKDLIWKELKKKDQQVDANLD